MDDETRIVAARIAATAREVQRTKGLSTPELASRAGLEPAELDAILSGEEEVPLPAIFLLAGALRIPPAQLLEGIEWVPAEHGGGGFRVSD
jgi:transcriptional regulator with XRE-family HTH domain